MSFNISPHVKSSSNCIVQQNYKKKTHAKLLALISLRGLLTSHCNNNFCTVKCRRQKALNHNKVTSTGELQIETQKSCLWLRRLQTPKHGGWAQAQTVGSLVFINHTIKIQVDMHHYTKACSPYGNRQN